MNLVAFRQQQLCQVRAVLASYPRYQCLLHVPAGIA
jgi:hypothetical protein